MMMVLQSILTKARSWSPGSLRTTRTRCAVAGGSSSGTTTPGKAQAMEAGTVAEAAETIAGESAVGAGTRRMAHLEARANTSMMRIRKREGLAG